MVVQYVDTSALVKRYVAETGTAWVRAMLDSATGCAPFVARATAVELAAAVTRRARAGYLSAADAALALRAFRADLASQYAVVELTEPVASLAMDLAACHGLRAYDAIQLASALTVHAQSAILGHGPVTFVSADVALNAAAVSEGLATDDPNSYP